MLFVALLMALFSSGCSGMHDGKGWEHSGDPATHEDSKPYIFEHEH